MTYASLNLNRSISDRFTSSAQLTLRSFGNCGFQTARNGGTFKSRPYLVVYGNAITERHTCVANFNQDDNSEDNGGDDGCS